MAGLVGAIRLGIATGAGLPISSLRFSMTSPGRAPTFELTVVESFGGTLLRDLRDGRLDAMVAPSVSSARPSSSGRSSHSEPVVVLAGAAHRSRPAPGPIGADELDGERVVVTGHRDGAGYDRYVTETLTELGVTPVTTRGGPGPALLGPVLRGRRSRLGHPGRRRGRDVRPPAPAGARGSLRPAVACGGSVTGARPSSSGAAAVQHAARRTPASGGGIERARDGTGELDRLRRDASRRPLLTAVEEVRLAKRIERGDLRAKDEMIERNLRLIFALARRYAGRGVPLEDLVQEGTIGLVRAVEKFDYRRDLRFSRYAVWWIRRSLIDALSAARTIRIPSSAGRQLAAIHRAEAELQPPSRWSGARRGDRPAAPACTPEPLAPCAPRHR